MLFSPDDKPLISSNDQCEIIINVGFPACGKTTFAKKWFVDNGNYIHVNQVKKKKSNNFCFCKYQQQSLLTYYYH